MSAELPRANKIALAEAELLRAVRDPEAEDGDIQCWINTVRTLRFEPDQDVSVYETAAGGRGQVL